MQFIGLLIVGLIIGVLARLLVPGRQRIGLAFTLMLGVLGALIGGTIASVIDAGEMFELNFVGFVAAVLTSVGAAHRGRQRPVSATAAVASAATSRRRTLGR